MCTLTVPYPYRIESTPPCVINFYPWKPEAVKNDTRAPVGNFENYHGCVCCALYIKFTILPKEPSHSCSGFPGQSRCN